MKNLRNACLFGGGLVCIDSPRLVERYNRALAQIGLAKTILTKFSIDGIGWSPEVAEERGRVKYFSPDANSQSAILLTPSQKGLPIHTPFNSFDRALMKKYFPDQVKD